MNKVGRETLRRSLYYKCGIHSGWMATKWMLWMTVTQIRKSLPKRITSERLFSSADPPDIVSGPPMTEHFILTTVDSLIKWPPRFGHLNCGRYAQFILLELAVFSHRLPADLARPSWPIPFVWQSSFPPLRVQRLCVYRLNEVSARGLWRIVNR